MSTVLEQLGLNQTFFMQLVIFAVLFIFLGNFYFKPFLRLFEARKKRKEQDQQTADRLVSEANQKFEEYHNKLTAERLAAKRDVEAVVLEAKKEEHQILTNARLEARKISQEAQASIQKQRETLKKQLESDINGLAKNISEVLLSGSAGGQ